MLKRYTRRIATMLLITFPIAALVAQTGTVIKTNHEQKKLLSTFRFILEQADNDYRDFGATDKLLFPPCGEGSLYRPITGANAGNIIYPDKLPDEYASLNQSNYNNYNWKGQAHVSVQFKKHPKRIAIFKSKYKTGGGSINWEAVYFERLFSEFLMDNIAYTIDEEALATQGPDLNTTLLIIPAFAAKDINYTYYIDSIFSVAKGFKAKIDQFLGHGGSIYAEGNASYFIEKLGYLDAGAIDYKADKLGEGDIDVVLSNTTDILSLGADAAGFKLYGPKFPKVASSRIQTIANNITDNNPVIFKISNSYSLGGKIHCNTGLPCVSGLSGNNGQGQQISWVLNSILASFSYDIDVTRKVKNALLHSKSGDNTISYDRLDTFDVELLARNLSNSPITIDITETIKPYFTFLGVVSGPTHSLADSLLKFNGINLIAHGELKIVYRLITPMPDNPIHEQVNKYLDKGTFMAVSKNKTTYAQNGALQQFGKNKDYADIMFSARIFADTDVNWKNFLGLYYQPFKVFMIMENKSRGAAEKTEYVQYIPKDVPFYWSDSILNIPILKTPGGKYVDILRGSNDESKPEYDMDSDGDPDIWLDTTSIYPKGYKIIEEKVYWANPWNHLRTGDKSFVFEDIDHDGLVPEDTDKDGVVDKNFDEGDKIRVWKVTWNIGHVAGYEYYDPYCSYQIWVDPPDLVPLSAGVANAYNPSSVEGISGTFYPYGGSKTDTTWSHWMERGANGKVKWRQLIQQRINNYEGFTFVDTANYQMLPTDRLYGTVPQPHREFIAVLSLGGEEIDMQHYTPTQSLYSKVNYETEFGEKRVTPIRTTYTYWAPLPNPLQFEFLSNNFEIIDTAGKKIQELPEYGKAQLVFDVDASTEYSYYWIRNYGTDVQYNDASQSIDGIEGLGDGVFGYFVYTIPKGMGGYRITLPKNADGSYNTDSIVKIDGQPFAKRIDNPNTSNKVDVYETPFEYQVFIPQLLIPAALDDNNFDGKDDWIDDRGDRFSSKTGFRHDLFMPGNGEAYLNYPPVPFVDDIYGKVDSGWYAGADGTNGDDLFETLGKTHIKIHANYEGRGREGSVEISKGGVLVCEEIFGGSPWVIFSHVLSGFAKGTDVTVKSEVIPEVIYYGVDTVYLKHVVADTNEPHSFDANFDPYHVSYGYGSSTITTYVGAKDPCTLIEPAMAMPAIIDPGYDQHTITLVPLAGGIKNNPDLAGYPRTVTGAFVEIRVEVGNSTNDNWINTSVVPQIPAAIGTVELSYVAYPRPLVPSHASGDIILLGDQPGTFTTGWRFNQPEGEVLIKMGNTLNLLQPTRRAYFVFLVKINPTLKNGIYQIPFTLTGNRVYYTGKKNGALSYGVPNAMFSIVDKDAKGNITAFQKLVLDNTSLTNLNVSATSNFVATGEVRYSNQNIDVAGFNSVKGKLASSGSIIDLSKFKNFPSVDTSQLVILQKGTVDSYNTEAEILTLTQGQTLNFKNAREGDKSVFSERLVVKPIGPRIKITNAVYSINGIPVEDTIIYGPEKDLYVKTILTVKNTGTDISSKTIIRINPGPYYTVKVDSLDNNCKYDKGVLSINMGDIIPGELKEQYLPFILKVGELPKGVDIRMVIDLSVIEYEGTLVDVSFKFEDPKDVLLDVLDFEAFSISFSDLGNNQVEVTAQANNRGIDGKNVWFRIYPIVGGGAHEFPIAEIRQKEFLPGAKITLKGTYTIPVAGKSIEFIAIIDDAQNYTEFTELNNSIKTSFTPTSAETGTFIANELKVFPVPFTDFVNFNYSLSKTSGNMYIAIYDIRGRVVFKVENCPASQGLNSITWRNSNLPQGTYVYQIVGQTDSGKPELLFKGAISKTAY